MTQHNPRLGARDLRSHSAAHSSPRDPDEIWDTAGLAAYTGLSVSKFEKDRHFRDPNGCPYFRIGRSIRYRRSDVDKWLESKREGGAK